MKNLWLIFAQAVTVCVAALFVVTTLKPEWVQKTALPAPQQTIAVPAATFNEAPRSVSTAPIASFADAAKRASSAVVNVYTKQKRADRSKDARLNDPFFKFFFGDKAPRPRDDASSLGSGVIVSTDGIVLTNNHVIEGADAIEVVLSDGRRAQATVLGTDPDSDLAVLRIKLDNIPAIEWGSLGDVRIGDVVLAVGNPFGVGQTVTQGIVSALGRNHLGINTFENFIQTDAAINPGNSGGALTDSQGRLIGINTAIYSKDGGSLGIGFAIPVTTVRQVMEQLLKSGSVTRGYIGVTPEDITAAVREELKLPDALKGCAVLGVQKGSPAAVGGVIAGDVVQQINGVTILDRAGLLNAIAGTAPGSAATVQVWRAGKVVDLKLVVGTRPKQERAAKE